MHTSALSPPPSEHAREASRSLRPPRGCSNASLDRPDLPHDRRRPSRSLRNAPAVPIARPLAVLLERRLTLAGLTYLSSYWLFGNTVDTKRPETLLFRALPGGLAFLSVVLLFLATLTLIFLSSLLFVRVLFSLGLVPEDLRQLENERQMMGQESRSASRYSESWRHTPLPGANRAVGRFLAQDMPLIHPPVQNIRLCLTRR